MIYNNFTEQTLIENLYSPEISNNSYYNRVNFLSSSVLRNLFTADSLQKNAYNGKKPLVVRIYLGLIAKVYLLFNAAEFFPKIIGNFANAVIRTILVVCTLFQNFKFKTEAINVWNEFGRDFFSSFMNGLCFWLGFFVQTNDGLTVTEEIGTLLIDMIPQEVTGNLLAKAALLNNQLIELTENLGDVFNFDDAIFFKDKTILQNLKERQNQIEELTVEYNSLQEKLLTLNQINNRSENENLELQQCIKDFKKNEFNIDKVHKKVIVNFSSYNNCILSESKPYQWTSLKWRFSTFIISSSATYSMFASTKKILQLKPWKRVNLAYNLKNYLLSTFYLLKDSCESVVRVAFKAANLAIRIVMFALTLGLERSIRHELVDSLIDLSLNIVFLFVNLLGIFHPNLVKKYFTHQIKFVNNELGKGKAIYHITENTNFLTNNLNEIRKEYNYSSLSEEDKNLANALIKNIVLRCFKEAYQEINNLKKLDASFQSYQESMSASILNQVQDALVIMYQNSVYKFLPQNVLVKHLLKVSSSKKFYEILGSPALVKKIAENKMSEIFQSELFSILTDEDKMLLYEGTFYSREAVKKLKKQSLLMSDFYSLMSNIDYAKLLLILLSNTQKMSSTRLNTAFINGIKVSFKANLSINQGVTNSLKLKNVLKDNNWLDQFYSILKKSNSKDSSINSIMLNKFRIKKERKIQDLLTHLENLKNKFNTLLNVNYNVFSKKELEVLAIEDIKKNLLFLSSILETIQKGTDVTAVYDAILTLPTLIKIFKQTSHKVEILRSAIQLMTWKKNLGRLNSIDCNKMQQIIEQFFNEFSLYQNNKSLKKYISNITNKMFPSNFLQEAIQVNHL